MKPFAYARPKSISEALSLLSATARPKGAGIDLLDLAKTGHPSPEILVDVRGVQPGIGPGGLYTGKDEAAEGFRINAHATLTQLAGSKDLLQHAPALSDAAGEAATPQIRNVATLAGNLLQRPRCAYFRDLFFDCRKRGGKSCPALDGEHSEGAIFGNGLCCAVHPSNLAVALVALDARLLINSASDAADEINAEDSMAAAFFLRPEEDPLREARIATNQILESVMFRLCPASAYVEVDQKQSFDWASASAAVALVMEGGKVKSARVALGAVAPVPLLSEAAAKALVGKVPDEAAAKAAGEAAVQGATPLRDNGHKVQHLRICVQRAVLKAAARGR